MFSAPGTAAEKSGLTEELKTTANSIKSLSSLAVYVLILVLEL